METKIKNTIIRILIYLIFILIKYLLISFILWDFPNPFNSISIIKELGVFGRTIFIAFFPLYLYAIIYLCEFFYNALKFE